MQLASVRTHPPMPVTMFDLSSRVSVLESLILADLCFRHSAFKTFFRSLAVNTTAWKYIVPPLFPMSQ